MIKSIKNDQKNSSEDQNQNKNGKIGEIWIDGTGKHPKTRRT